jgi:hypothetical protein
MHDSFLIEVAHGFNYFNSNAINIQWFISFVMVEEFPDGLSIAVLEKEVVIICRLESAEIPNYIRMFQFL